MDNHCSCLKLTLSAFIYEPPGSVGLRNWELHEEYSIGRRWQQEDANY